MCTACGRGAEPPAKVVSADRGLIGPPRRRPACEADPFPKISARGYEPAIAPNPPRGHPRRLDTRAQRRFNLTECRIVARTILNA